MNNFVKMALITVLLFNSHKSFANIITWDFEFEVSFVEDRTNGAWSNPLVAGDILSASLSFDSNSPVLDDNSYQTVFDVSNATFDIVELTSNQWLTNLDPLSWVNHSPSRESGSIRSSYSVDNALTGNINWEAMYFSFIDDNPVQSYTSFPINWGNVPVSFTYHRDLDANSSGSEIYITGQSISATQRMAVPEPTTLVLFLIAILFIGSRKLKVIK
ncbi:PEP-CTERM sorting domain-containing protein [Colwellia psychrerythraea]|uniref:PEP motif putative anchor domain protein n=1 Tax=Colwellia psychrerythraea TaxID=28229 RepID=A0A099KPZ4_COLPS|nr:PEP-CTERM sorting domain-containing protein [Colwellia psychrerythraea]KGJ91693.1 PEP motif putative anchor domain protein [Colwellia psychrerythraea]